MAEITCKLLPSVDLEEVKLFLKEFNYRFQVMKTKQGISIVISGKKLDFKKLASLNVFLPDFEVP